MAFLGGFDASKVDPAGDFTPLPAGEYVAVIKKSEQVPTKNKEGEMLVFEWVIQDAAHKGRTIKQRLNIKNRNTVAVDIATRELSAICRATGVMRPSDSTDLHGIPCKLLVAVSADCKWNEIKGVSPLVAATQPGGEASRSEKPAGPVTDKPSWMAQ
jgi:hypothetical protein